MYFIFKLAPFLLILHPFTSTAGDDPILDSPKTKLMDYWDADVTLNLGSNFPFLENGANIGTSIDVKKVSPQFILQGKLNITLSTDGVKSLTDRSVLFMSSGRWVIRQKRVEDYGSEKTSDQQTAAGVDVFYIDQDGIPGTLNVKEGNPNPAIDTVRGSLKGILASIGFSFLDQWGGPDEFNRANAVEVSLGLGYGEYELTFHPDQTGYQTEDSGFALQCKLGLKPFGEGVSIQASVTSVSSRYGEAHFFDVSGNLRLGQANVFGGLSSFTAGPKARTFTFPEFEQRKFYVGVGFSLF